MDPEGIRVLPGRRSAVPDARHSCNDRFAESDSARAARARPFYASRADAYDAIITTPVDGWVTELQRLRAQGTVLDAGCGTGRYTHALTVADFDAELLDASPALLGEARRRCSDLPTHQVDMCTMDLGRDFDIVACRGVLNDMVTEVDRSTAVQRLAAHVAPGGFLVLDLRERDATRARAGAVTSNNVLLPDGRSVRFGSSSRWSEPLLLVSERHETQSPGRPAAIEPYKFAMRPWTESELEDAPRSAGLTDVPIGPAMYRSSADRLMATARCR